MLSFLSSTTGVNIYKHYCGDFLEGISIYVKGNPCEDEGGESMCSQGKETDCCEDETEFYQLETDLFKQQSNTKNFETQPVLVELKYALSVVEEVEDKSYLNLDIPKSKYQNPLYQEFQQLVFYG